MTETTYEELAKRVRKDYCERECGRNVLPLHLKVVRKDWRKPDTESNLETVCRWCGKDSD